MTSRRSPRTWRRVPGTTTGGTPPPPPAGSVALTSHAGGETIDVLRQETISGTFSGSISAVEVFWEGVSIGLAALGAGTWSLNWTPTDAQAAYGGEITVEATGDGDPTAGPVTVDVYGPTLETGLIRYVDAGDAAAITHSSGTVTGLTNKVSSTVENTGTLPGYSATGLNGLPTMTFNGTSQAITTTEAAVVNVLNANDPPHTLITVAQYTTAARFGALFCSGVSGSSNNHHWFGQDSTGSGRHASYRRTTTNAIVGSTGAPTTNPHISVWVSSGTSAMHQVNSAAADPGMTTQNTVALAAGTIAAMGARVVTAGLDLFHAGNISQQLLFNAEKDAAAIARLVGHLTRRWSIV